MSKKNYKMCEEVITQQVIYEPRSYVNLSMLFDMEELSFFTCRVATNFITCFSCYIKHIEEEHMFYNQNPKWRGKSAENSL